MNEPVTIPDEAVDAAYLAWFEDGGKTYGHDRMRIALEAAAPALREQFLTAAGLERTPVGITPDGVVIDERRPRRSLR